MKKILIILLVILCGCLGYMNYKQHERIQQLQADLILVAQITEKIYNQCILIEKELRQCKQI